MTEPTYEDIREAINTLREHQCRPKMVKSWWQAWKMRRRDNALLGIDSKWRKGDEYWEIRMHPDALRYIENIDNPHLPEDYKRRIDGS